eukprot:TRINITY_DN25099_c0_g1_i1.p1 TRINITY_DN25099_c0_g1~~TRINITY_DN25099_c0_g1_i1.p1  ORF type:complete len:317 (-),score=76.40 TRINITY_DN25099_c0_g1_i1:42-962(-)
MSGYAAASPEAPPAAVQEQLREGTLVEVTGLLKAQDLNGRRGVIVKPLNSDGRYGIWLLPTSPGSANAKTIRAAEKAVKADNLRVAESESEKAKRILPFLKMYKEEIVNQILGRARGLDVPVEEGGRPNTADDKPRVTPVTGETAKKSWRAGAEALAMLHLCGVNLENELKEESGVDNLYTDWLLCGASESETMRVVDGFAIKALDTIGIFDDAGDTFCDVAPLLKTVPGFAMLSKALDSQFQIEDSLTSGYNNFVTFGNGKDAEQLGKSIESNNTRFSRHSGPGSLKSKKALRESQGMFDEDDVS